MACTSFGSSGADVRLVCADEDEIEYCDGDGDGDEVAGDCWGGVEGSMWLLL